MTVRQEISQNSGSFHFRFVIPVKTGIHVFVLNSCKGTVNQLAGYKEGKQPIHATLDNEKTLGFHGGCELI